MNISNTAKLLFFFLILLSISSCDDEMRKITVREIGSDTNLYGYTNSTFLFEDTLNWDNAIDTTGLYLEIKNEILKSVSLKSNEKYELSNGVRIGQSKDEIINILGSPLQDGITITKGSNASLSTDINALVYKNVLILFDDQDLAGYITFGDIENN